MTARTQQAPMVLGRVECERRLRAGYTGRVGFVDDGRPQVLPVNYVYADGAVIFQTGPGAKLDTALREAVVAFEIDELDDQAHAGWSVQVVGRCQVIDRRDEIAWARALPLRPWAYGGRRPFWVRIDPTEITGRSFA